MRTANWLRRTAATLLTALFVAGVTVVAPAPAQAADGFSVDDFAGNAMGTRSAIPASGLNCDVTDKTSLTMGTGTMRVNIDVPDSRGCRYASSGVIWTADTSVNIEQNGADRIILKYRDVFPNQPSAVTFGLRLVDVNGRTATVGGLTRNGGAAGNWLTIRYVPEYVGDVSVLSFQGGFDKGHVKSVALYIAATTNNQNIAVTFEGIGTNVGEPSYVAPSFGSAAFYEFPENTSTTKTFTVTGNPAPDVSWTGKPSWMTITTSTTSGGRQVTMTGNPGTAYSDSNISFHANVASSLTADAAVRIVVPSPVTVTANATNTTVGTAGPIVVGTATAIPSPTSVTGATGLPPGTSLGVSGTNIVLNGTPTTPGTFSVAATVGNDFRTAPFSRTIVVGQVPAIDTVGTQAFLRGSAIVPLKVNASGYPEPSIAITNLPAGLTATNGVISGTPTTTSTTVVSVQATNSFGADTKTFTINVGDAPTVTAPSTLDLIAGTALDETLPVTGVPTTFTATDLPAGVSAQFSGGVAKLVGTPTRPASPAAASGTATVTVTNDFGSQSKQGAWTVKSAPQFSGPPSLVAPLGAAITPVVIAVDSYPTSTITIHDLGGDDGLLPQGLSIDTSTPNEVRITGTPTAVGSQAIRIDAFNGVTGITYSHSIAITVTAAPVFANTAPEFLILQGTTEVFDVSPEGYPKPTLTLQSALPPWLTFDASTGEFTASPAASVSGDWGPFRVQATNLGGTATINVRFKVTTPPNLTLHTTSMAVLQGVYFSQSYGDASGIPHPQVTVEGLPAGLTAFSGPFGLEIEGQTTAPTGEYTVEVTADNGIGEPVTRTLTLTVQAPATLAVPTTAILLVGQTGAVTPTIGGYPLPTVSATGLPAGLAIDPATGIISGVPTATGIYSVTLSANGGAGPAPAPVVVEITVASLPVFGPAPSDLTLRLGELVGSPAFGVGGFPAPTASATGLPAGLSIAEASGAVSLEGTPTETGVFAVTVTVTNAAGSAQHTWNITVEDPAQVSVAPTATVDLGEPITAIPVTTGGYPAPTVTASGLPDGLELVSDIAGTRIVGTPTEDGEYAVLLTATNGVGTAATAPTTIQVRSEPSLGADIDAGFPAGETTTLALPITGYPAPVLTTSALPAWLTFDAITGVFSANPAVGDSGPGGTVTVTATSVAGVTQIDVTLEVTSPPAVAASGGTVTVLAGEMVNESLTAVTGYPEPTVTATGVPSGLALSLVEGVLTLTGSTSDSGTHAITVTLANGSGPDLDVPWTVVVNEPAALSVPTDATGVLGDALDIEIVATGYPAPTVTVTGLPDGLTFQPGAGGGHVVGSPTVAGTSTIEVTATNGIGTDATESFTLTVDLPQIDVTLSAGTVTAGDTVGIEADGFQSGENVRIELHSTPVLLANVTADSAGRVDLKVTVPASTAAGAHDLVVIGATGATGSAQVTVLAADELSGTGAELAIQGGLALAILAAGVVMLIAVRRFGQRGAI